MVRRPHVAQRSPYSASQHSWLSVFPRAVRGGTRGSGPARSGTPTPGASGEPLKRGKEMNATEINALICTSDSDYAAALARAEANDARTYAAYHGIDPTPPAGSPQAAGHGSRIGGFVGQEEWYAARAALNQI